jgi:hypothetical protein
MFCQALGIQRLNFKNSSRLCGTPNWGAIAEPPGGLLICTGKQQGQDRFKGGNKEGCPEALEERLSRQGKAYKGI